VDKEISRNLAAGCSARTCNLCNILGMIIYSRSQALDAKVSSLVDLAVDFDESRKSFLRRLFSPLHTCLFHNKPGRVHEDRVEYCSV
jgi:hypothetical protein